MALCASQIAPDVLTTHKQLWPVDLRCTADCMQSTTCTTVYAGYCLQYSIGSVECVTTPLRLRGANNTQLSNSGLQVLL